MPKIDNNITLLESVLHSAEKNPKLAKGIKSFKKKIADFLREDVAIEKASGWGSTEHQGVDKAIDFIEHKLNIGFTEDEAMHLVSDLMKMKKVMLENEHKSFSERVSGSLHSIASKASELAGTVIHGVTDPVLNNVPGIATTKIVIGPKVKCSNEWALETGQYRKVKSNVFKDARTALAKQSEKKVIPLVTVPDYANEEATVSSKNSDNTAVESLTSSMDTAERRISVAEGLHEKLRYAIKDTSPPQRNIVIYDVSEGEVISPDIRIKGSNNKREKTNSVYCI